MAAFRHSRRCHFGRIRRRTTAFRATRCIPRAPEAGRRTSAFGQSEVQLRVYSVEKLLFRSYSRNSNPVKSSLLLGRGDHATRSCARPRAFYQALRRFAGQLSIAMHPRKNSEQMQVRVFQHNRSRSDGRVSRKPPVALAKTGNWSSDQVATTTPHPHFRRRPGFTTSFRPSVRLRVTLKWVLKRIFASNPLFVFETAFLRAVSCPLAIVATL
jgi:hypothetical protein